ncbi:MULTISPECIES: response regulator receiver domain [unclassified Rhodococcus (in: high G+C Gram-positive bacteria)]|uniref:response regulator receiver domain n=1 Tax=unclassified Rhodococcus (in: high G+C Gram-positive bacteria) TaxID=192944 RepID=UPI0020CCB801|nr:MULTISPECIES: response regulator receiver domain [unclassified Rhodococcus (in: high G+C Gram-positive bacteria)]
MVSRFERHVQKQVLDFLQTVLMIDDEAFRKASRPQVDSGESWGDDETPYEVGGVTKLSPPSETFVGDELDAQEVSVCFAEKGLTCAILSPQTSQENEEFKPAFVKTAKRADALILDWNLNEDDGKTTLKLIDLVLKDDTKSPKRRLRLFIIYTGEPDLEKIAERVCIATDRSLTKDEVHWDSGFNLAFSRGPVRVAVFAKEHVQHLPRALSNRKRKISSLPLVVVEEFSRHSMGLATSASLSALAGIRNDAHRLIAALAPELDAAILGQRVSVPHPEDVERQVESLIASELLAIVQDHQVGSHMGFQRIKEWLNHNKHLSPRGITEWEIVTADLRLELLSDGFSDSVVSHLIHSGTSKNKLEKMRREGAAFFSSSADERIASDRLFAVRMSMRSRYSKPVPVLQLGSIIEQRGAYAVCVQPLCDSVRIEGKRDFPLLPLEIAKEGDGVPGDGLLTVPDDRVESGFVRLRVRAKPARLLMQEFKAGDSGVVQARSYNGVRRFASTSGQTWRWVGELKTAHAQRVAEKLSAQFSRVGLDEAEVLRQGL